MKFLFLAAAFLSVGHVAKANEVESQIRQYIKQEVVHWARDQILIDAILAQNSTTVGLSDDEVLDLDRLWHSEIGSAERPIITWVTTNPAARYLRSRVAESGGVISEIFLMDNRGLNVAASVVTPNFWQGKEGKFQQTYFQGADAVFVDDLDFDLANSASSARVSMTVADPNSGEPIGAITIGLNAGYFY